MADDEDLGALFARVTRRLIDAERPLLAELGLTMWGYIALSCLARASTETQLALAQTMGYDKTRLIGLLDELEAAGLITRTPDPADRRARIIALTDAGVARHAAARRAIARMEDDLLADVSATERTRLRRTLGRLAAGARRT